jgi:hypothetical protein
MRHRIVMRMPSPAISCLLLGLVGGVILWMLGENSAAIAILIAEAIGWALIHASSGKRE